MTVNAPIEFFVEAYSKPSAGLAQRKEISIGAVALQSDTPDTGGAIGQNFNHPQRFQVTLTNANVTTTDHTTNGAQGTMKLGAFPKGVIHVLGGVANLTLARVGTQLAVGAAVIGSIGTAQAGQDLTLTGTEANIVASTACTLSSGSGSFKAVGAAANTIDGTASALPIYLNFDVPDADSAGNDALSVNGTVDITFIWCGDK